MTLTFSDIEAGHPEGGRVFQATDAATGAAVAVRASDESLQDFGFARVQQVAGEKYDSGNIEPNGSVWVRSSDC